MLFILYHFLRIPFSWIFTLIFLNCGTQLNQFDNQMCLYLLSWIVLGHPQKESYTLPSALYLNFQISDITLKRKFLPSDVLKRYLLLEFHSTPCFIQPRESSAAYASLVTHFYMQISCRGYVPSSIIYNQYR